MRLGTSKITNFDILDMGLKWGNWYTMLEAKYVKTHEKYGI